MFGIDSFTPHGFCLAWDPPLVWLQAISDLVIAAAYFSIPVALIRFARRRRDLAFPWVFRLFAAFIVACGATHVMAVVTLWLPAYWTEGLVKLVTALVSVGTAIMLWPLLPRALSLPSREQMEALNRRLADEVAEREAVANKLRVSEGRLRSIYARTPAPLHAVDMEGGLLTVSDHWLDLLGYHRNEVLGAKLSHFIAPETRDQARKEWDSLLRQGSLRDQEQTLLHRDGSVRHVLIASALERDSQGMPWLAVSSVQDITGRRQTEAALEASEAHLRQAQKMEAVGQLTGGIAHDFDNMLTAVNCVMELLHKRLPEKDSSRALVSSVLEASGRAAKLTSQLLAFSRRQRLMSEPLDPIGVARDMGALLTRPLGEHVRLEIREPGGELWPVMADRNQLEAALLNLVLNARAAIDGEGAITIEARRISAGDEGASLALPAGETPLAAGDYVGLSVTDTGHGMTEETRKQAFEPFFTTKPVGQGTGLGLSQTYGFARQSAGTVTIESAVGVGTTVTIVLPRATVPVAPPEDAGQPPEIAGNGLTVLLVEDEDTLRDVVTAALQEYGYRLVPARNADEALALIERGASMDVLFTDIMMPGSLNGVELALRLRRRWPGLPVLFATGYSDRRVLERWPGRIEVLPKPYSIDAVARSIEAARMSVLDLSVRAPG